MMTLKTRIVRPKMRNDVLYLPTGNGVYLLNNKSAFTLRGNGIYEWVDRIAPALDGRRTLEELTAGLSADKRSMIVDLVTVLADHGFIRECENDAPHELSPAELSTFGSEIAFIEYFRDSAARRFQRFRESRVVVIGSGLTAVALVRAFLQLGVLEVRARFTDESPLDEAWLAESLADAHRRDPRQRVVRVDDSGAFTDLVAGVDLVAHASDRPMLARTLTLDRICADRRIAFASGTVIGNTAWIGPLVLPGSPGRWEHAWHRLLRNLPDEDRLRHQITDHRSTEPGEFLSSPTASIAASQLAFEVFKWICEVPDPELAGHLLELDLELLSGRRHRFEPGIIPAQDQGGDSQESFRRRLDAHRGAPLVDNEAFSRGARNCVDSRCGVFSTVEEAELPQLPLRAARIRFPSETGETEVVRCGLDLAAARSAAARRACELVAAATVDPARIAIGGGVWGIGLRDGRIRKVSTDDAFSKTSPGLASGSSWDAALRRALLQLAADRGRDHLLETEAAFPEVSPSDQELTDRGRALADMLAAMDSAPHVLDLSGSGRISVLAAIDGDALVDVHADVDPLTALEDSLQSLVRHGQSRISGHPLGAGPVVTLPSGRRGPLRQKGLPEPLIADLAGLVDEVLADGEDLVAIPLDHEPALAFWPHVVNLVTAS